MDEVRQADLLLALVRSEWDRARQLAAGGVDAAAFVETCRLSDVHGWLHEHLKRHDRFDVVGDEVRDALAQLRGKSRKDNLLVLAVGMQAIDAMLERGITVVGLKGIDWLHRFYAPFDTRAMDDVDVLVPRDQLIPALDALQTLGWKVPEEPKRTQFIRSSHHLPTSGPGPVPVELELHWNLAQDGRYSIDPDALIERSLPLEVDGRTIRRLEDHDAAAHILVHHLSHYFDRRLKWLIDLRHLSERPGLSWRTVVDRLDEWGALVAGAGAIRHLHKLWPEVVPESAVRMLPLSAWRRLATAPLVSRHPLELYRATGGRRVRMYLAAVFLERPLSLPGWLWHRYTRDRHESDNPLELTVGQGSPTKGAPGDGSTASDGRER